MMHREEAYEYVRNLYSDDVLSTSTLIELFEAIYGRHVTKDDHEDGLWSLLAAATPGLCGCSTRTEHERYACRPLLHTCRACGQELTETNLMDAMDAVTRRDTADVALYCPSYNQEKDVCTHDLDDEDVWPAQVRYVRCLPL